MRALVTWNVQIQSLSYECSHWSRYFIYFITAMFVSYNSKSYHNAGRLRDQLAISTNLVDNRLCSCHYIAWLALYPGYYFELSEMIASCLWFVDSGSAGLHFLRISAPMMAAFSGSADSWLDCLWLYSTAVALLFLPIFLCWGCLFMFVSSIKSLRVLCGSVF